MEDDKVVKIATLRKVFNGILDFIENDLAKNEVDLQKDHYWEIPECDVYETSRPTQLVAGSLIDDWHFLTSAAKDKEQQIPIMLAHLAPILQALSQAVPSYTSSKGSTED